MRKMRYKWLSASLLYISIAIMLQTSFGSQVIVTILYPSRHDERSLDISLGIKDMIQLNGTFWELLAAHIAHITTMS